MEFLYRYLGESSVSARDGETAMSFVPDALRPPTYFRGEIGRQVEFREAISALHDVVTSDLRFVPKDRTSYMAWRATQSYVNAEEVAGRQAQLAANIDKAQKELRALYTLRNGRWGQFYKARQKYFDYLYERDRQLWFKLDPVITVHPDQIFFECFSRDESSYGRLAASYNVFSQLGERQNGTTNIDYSEALYGEFQKIRSYKSTRLEIDPAGFSVATTAQDAYHEAKIDVPDTWVRGFLQVSAAMTLPAHELVLHPLDVQNLCLYLRRHKEQHGPRSLRFVCKPGAPVSIVVEPFGHIISCPRSRFLGQSEQEIRIWGRRRLLILERLLPLARQFRVLLLGTGMPSFWMADLGDLSFTLGLSGWSKNNWSDSGNFDLLAAREQVDSETQRRVFDKLGESWRASSAELAASLGLDKVMVESALVGWVQNGRVMYDLEEGVYRKRELTREPLAMEHLRFVNEREQRAAVLLHRAQVAIESVDTTEAGTTVKARLQDGKKVYAVELAFDVERRIKAAECGCDYYIQNRLHRGPCEHMLALRAAQERGISDRSVGPVNVVRGRRVDAPSKSARADAAVAPAGFDVAPESGSSTAPGRFPWQRDLALSVRTTFLPFDADTALIARVGDMTAAPGMPSAANPDLMCVLTLRTGNARRKFASIPDSRERRDDDPLAILAIGNAVDDFVRSQGAQWERGDVVAFIRSDLTARDCVDWTLRLGIVPWVLGQQGFHRVGRRSATQPAPFDAAGTPSPTVGEPASKPTLWRRIASVFKRGGSAETAAATQGEPEVEGEPIIALLKAMRPQVPEDFDRVLRLSRLLQRCRTMSQSDRHAQLAASLHQDEIVRRAFSDQELISLLRRYIP